MQRKVLGYVFVYNSMQTPSYVRFEETSLTFFLSFFPAYFQDAKESGVVTVKPSLELVG